MATPLWQRKAGKSPTGGLTPAGSKSAGVGRPVTESNPKGKRKARKKSFCARMKGMRKRQKPSNNTGKDRLSLSLKKWKCRKGGTCKPDMYKTGGKKKGADGKACWKGYRYAGTVNGKDRCVPVNKKETGGFLEPPIPNIFE